MKYLRYFFTAIVSACLVILVSLASCSPNPQTTPTQPMVMEHSPTSKPQTSTIPAESPSQVSSQPADVTVKIQKFKFEPANVTIVAGKTIQFINLDEEPHTATSTDGTFNSKALDTNQTWNYTPAKPGTFPYICSIHPFMKGTLTVTAKKN